VVTLSDSRSPANDRTGDTIVALLEAAGHSVAGRELVREDPPAIRAVLEAALVGPAQAVILNGGTGIAPRDSTPEIVAPLLERELPGFGELFRQLSFQEIGAAAMLSRALAGVAHGKLLFALPGSETACRLALEQLILPELGHLVGELRKG
jgi:molybdenum cofactor biosynthesis protein B